MCDATRQQNFFLSYYIVYFCRVQRTGTQYLPTGIEFSSALDDDAFIGRRNVILINCLLIVIRNFVFSVLKSVCDSLARGILDMDTKKCFSQILQTNGYISTEV